MAPFLLRRIDTKGCQDDKIEKALTVLFLLLVKWLKGVSASVGRKVAGVLVGRPESGFSGEAHCLAFGQTLPSGHYVCGEVCWE